MITLLCSISVPNYIHPATCEAAYELASHLRPDDYREVVEGHGHDPKVVLPLAVKTQPEAVYFTVPDGRIAGLAGVSNSAIWMLCTPAIHDFPITFAREAKRYVDRRKEPLLWNICDKRNTAHLKLLKFLGFKFLREVTHGPNNLTFIEFCKLCSIQ